MTINQLGILFKKMEGVPDMLRNPEAWLQFWSDLELNQKNTYITMF